MTLLQMLLSGQLDKYHSSSLIKLQPYLKPEIMIGVKSLSLDFESPFSQSEIVRLQISILITLCADYAMKPLFMFGVLRCEARVP